MEFELTPDIENIARAAVIAGAYESIDAFVKEAIRDKAEKVAAASPEQPLTNEEEWVANLNAIGSRLSATGFQVDDCRESFYPDRT
jgi:Arc/MetJ-type ribon-helix-helix transcriptional regulator